VGARGRDQGGEPREERERREHDAPRAIGEGPAKAVGDATVGRSRETGGGHGRAQRVATQMLELFAVLGGDGDAGVEREAVEVGAARLAQGRWLGVEPGEAPLAMGMDAGDGVGLEASEDLEDARVLAHSIRGAVIGPALEEASDLADDALEDGADVSVARGRHGEQRGSGPVVGVLVGSRLEDPVEHDGVEVRIEVQGGAEALRERDGSSSWLGDATRTNPTAHAASRERLPSPPNA